MKYIFTDASGQEITLKVKSVKGGVTHLEEASDEVVILAQQVYDDLTNEISMSGSHPGTCYEIITDRYKREHRDVSWESLTPELRASLVAYLEDLRADADCNEDDPFYNDGKAWTVEDTHF